MKNWLLIGCALLLLFGCESTSELENEISQIPVDIEVVRFDKIFGKANPSDLPGLKSEFPEFFPPQYADSIWLNRMTDTLQRMQEEEVLKVFPSEEKLATDLASLFQHIKYYDPQFRVPRVYTAISDVDYRARIIPTQDYLVIGVDAYLGADHPFYVDISKYITKNMRPDMIVSEAATAYSKRYITPPKQRSLLAQMIYFGKELYWKDLWLPQTSDADKIGFTEQEIIWAQANELDTWRYFVERELLYSTDQSLAGRFINPAPFSKFKLELDNESPGMIGRFIGWQIVKSYMEKNEVSVYELMDMKAEEIYLNSKYKPKR